MVEEHRSNVVQMAVECEKTSSTLVGPDLDLVVIPPRYEQRLRFMEVYAPHRPIMLLETVYQGAHTIIP